MLTSGNADGRRDVPQYLTAVGGTVYFSGFDPTNQVQLWASGGTAATTARLTSGNASQGGPQPADADGGRQPAVLLGATTGCTGRSCGRSTGTTPGAATMLTSANVAGGGVNPTNLAAVGSTLYFAGNDGVHGAQLWSSNGTSGGTAMVADINGTATANVANLTNVNGTLYFTAYTLSGGLPGVAERRDGGGTVQDTSLSTGGSTIPTALTADGQGLYFTAPGATMWQWQPAATSRRRRRSPGRPRRGSSTARRCRRPSSTPRPACRGPSAYTPAAGTVLGAGTDTLSVTFTPDRHDRLHDGRRRRRRSR